jgi:hypothetical protein
VIIVEIDKNSAVGGSPLVDKSPTQAIFDEIYKISANLGYDTYTQTPNTVGYPFVFIGEQFDTPNETKSWYEVGTVRTTVHLYGDENQRKKITEMARMIKRQCKLLRTANVYTVAYQSCYIQLADDKSTSQLLRHGILDITFQYAN